jgi:thiol:disulfide interchange protein DsbD
MRAGQVIAVFLTFLAGTVIAADPFGVDARMARRGSNVVVELSFRVPPGNHLYADTLSAAIQGEGLQLTVWDRTPPVSLRDAFSAAARDSYTNDFTIAYSMPTAGTSAPVVEVHYQGCNEELCFFPQSRSFRLNAAPSLLDGPQPGGRREAATGWRTLADGFRVTGKMSGYLRTGALLEFLDRCEGHDASRSGKHEGWWARAGSGYTLFSAAPVEFLRQFGAGWTVLVILMGGLLLNLTPCVLPMIPINLAILGVGAQGSSRARGFALGGAYGAGMAVVYGVLGLMVVLTGTQFGSLNAMPGFNLAIAVLFVVLGVAMFDVITIDFTRFQGGEGKESVFKRGSFTAALTMGGVAALLAGACVAPVVIAVLILSGALYAQGAAIGLVLPFMLGVGMALPWPLAGGGLARLPKPGAWMTRVKYGFGVFILLFALHYALLAYQGWKGSPLSGAVESGTVQVSPEREGDWAAVLTAARQDGVPVFVDFWATWCKNCEAMDATTFRAKSIRQRLSRYRVVKFQAEKPDDSATKEILDYYGVKGLPTYVVLMPLPLEVK